MTPIQDAQEVMNPSHDQIIAFGKKLASLGDYQKQNTHLTGFLQKYFGGTAYIWLKYPLKHKPELKASYPFDPLRVLTDEITETNDILTINRDEQYRTLATLDAGNEVIGLIIIDRQSQLTETELDLFRAVSSVAAIAIYSNLQTELKNWRQKQLSLVRSVSAQISQITELSVLTQTITKLVQETFGFYYVAIFLVSHDTGRLHFKNSAGADHGDRPEFENSAHPGFELGEHIIGHVAKTGLEVIANDVSLEPRYQIVDSLAKTKSEAVLPLKIENEVLGVFDVQSDEIDAFEEDNLLVLRALADNIAIAIKGTQLFQEAHNRAEQLATVSEVSRAVTCILDTDELLQRIVDLINERFDFPFVHIYTVDPVQERLVFKAGSGDRTALYLQSAVSYKLDAEKGLLPAVVREGKTKLINDVEKEPLFLESPFETALSGSEMAVPLTFGGEVLGVLDIQSEEKKAFTAEDQQLMETLADNLAIAIRNASLYRSEKWRRQVAESLRDVAGMLSENADLQQVMDAILMQLQKNLPCDVAGIWLFNEDAQDADSNNSRDLVLKAFYTSDEYQPDGLDKIVLHPDQWVENTLKQKQPQVRKPEDPIGPIGMKYNLVKNYSSIAAPLVTGDEILGMLTLIHHEPGRYGNESQKITSAFASYAAIAIDNNRLIRSSQEQAWISTILLQVAQATQSLTDLNELVGTIVRITPMVVGVKGCALFLREPNSKIFSLFDIYGIDPPALDAIPELPYPVLEAPVLQNLVSTQQPLTIAAPEKELNLPSQLAKELSKHTLILLPLASRNELLGALLLANEKQGDPSEINAKIFGDDQLRIVQGIIQQTAVAIENIRLIEDKQEEAYVSAVLLQSAQAIVSGRTLSDILDSIVSILPILVGIDASAIYLWDDVENCFEISHVIGSKDRENAELIGEVYPPGDFPMLDAVFQNNQPVVYPFIETVLPVEDWDLALPDEGQQNPTPILQSRYPLLLGFPLSVKDQVFGVLIAQDKNFSTNRERRFELLNGISQQASLAIQNDILNKEMLDRQRLEREFQLAREIQQTFLPDKIPDMPGWEMAVHWETARQVGGDFYDYFLLPDGRIAVVIADVSDKGLAASLYMTVTRTLLRAAALESNSPAKTLERVNELLLANSQNGLFVTTFYGVLSLTTGTLTYTMAGHNPPMIIRSDSKQVIALDKGGIALGALPNIELEDQQMKLNPGDCLVLYTDGVTEAFNYQDQMYGEDRLKRTLLSSIGRTAWFTLETIEKDLDLFRDNAPLSDDTTILTICRSGSLTDDDGDLRTS
ncbi:MAG TPA: hypothetical protein DCL08_00010 [Anaerolineaceae bacterium]|nr:MAG: hypothetical protein XE06_0627 [Anaerolineaceae bacterium 46_22]HAF47612.1 hypothetical protein [Anaerolineaceae bacterium]